MQAKMHVFVWWDMLSPLKCFEIPIGHLHVHENLSALFKARAEYSLDMQNEP